MYRVFLSSTSRDLADYRESVHRALDGLPGFQLVKMEDFGARDTSAKDLCARLVRECDLFVGLMGHYYGSCPPGEAVSFTELEYRTATAANLSRLMFVAPDDFPIPASLRESDVSFQRQQALRHEVMTDLVVAAFETPEKLASAVTRALFVWHEERRSVAETVAPEGGGGPGPAPAAPAAETPLGPNPYRGLEAFRKEDANRFFGREALVDQLWNTFLELHATRAEGEVPVRLLAILGASGSGKSSVAQAGLLAELEQRPLPGRPSPMAVLFTPEARPLESLAVALARQAIDQPSPAKMATEFEEVLRTRDGYDGLRYLAERMLDVGRAGLILLVDQFEELYSLCDDEHERASFIGNLLHAASEPRGRVSMILTLRSDFLGAVNQHPDLSGLIARQNVVVPVMGEDELRRAIEEPAKGAGREIDPGTVQLLLEQTRGREGALPLLEFVLTRIWEGFRRGVSSADTVREVGGIGGALARAAQELYGNLDPRERAIAKRAFLAMVRLGEGARDTRRRASVEDIVAGGEKPGDVLKVLREFARPEQRLVTLSATPEGFSTAEVTHEALFDHWSEFRSWLDRDRDQIRFARRLEAEVSDWLASGRPDGMLWRPPLLDLLRAYWQDKGAEMPAAQLQFFEASDRQERMREQKEAEEAAHRQEEERLRLENQRLKAEEAARRLEDERLRLQNELEEQALRASLEQQTKLAGAHRRFMRLAVAASVVAFSLAMTAGSGFWYAQQEAEVARAAAERALFERARADELAKIVQASSFWDRLQLFRDPLMPQDVATLWDLSQQDERVRVEFVRQLMENPDLLRRFGFKPQPIARAVGLRWPDEAQQIAMQTLTGLENDPFSTEEIDYFELIPYTRGLAALAPRLDPKIAAAATKNIANAINRLAEQRDLEDRPLSALVEAAGIFGQRLDPTAIEPARARLREMIRQATPTTGADRRTRATSRAIEVMAAELDATERLQAARYLVPLLGQDIDSWSANAVPRALTALLATASPGDTREVLDAVPSAIATAAVASGDDSYLLTLMQVIETLAVMDDETVDAAFSEAIAAQLALPNDARQVAALARAAVPFVEQTGSSISTLVPLVARTTLVPEVMGFVDPVHRSRLRQAALHAAETALRQTLLAPAGEQRAHAEAALQMLRQDWSADTSPGVRKAYRRAAQARLLGMLAPFLTENSAVLATADLLEMLPHTGGYLERDAIARALAALAPELPDTEREDALAAAKIALAKTGSTEEATAWARVIAALLPAEPRAATAVIAETLKYPTATEAPTDILLAALAKPWPEEYNAIAGRTLPDEAVVDWLEAHLPDGYTVADPPQSPWQRR